MKSREKSLTENSNSLVIGFRLESDAIQILNSRAATSGVSRHELARQYVIEMLQEAEIRAAMLQAIRGLNREITELREDFTLATQTLLVSAGKIDPTEAESWVAENFPP